MNMNILSIVTPPSIYHGCFIWKMFWEENFTLGEFTPMNMKNCGRLNVRKNRDIKDSDRYTKLGNHASKKKQNGDNDNDQKIYSSMAQMYGIDESPSRDFGDIYKLTNWILDSERFI